MSATSEARNYLLKYFGFSGFRQGQAEVIDALLKGQDCVGVMPTGGGKSLCYQLPAVMLGGTTLVISPLIALMKDQVDALRQRGIPATFLNGSLHYSDLLDRLTAIRKGAFKIIYVAPERLRNEGFVRAIAGADIKLFAVDEAHCISHWGHDFRPDYMRLAEAAKAVGRPPIVALTATATPRVRHDIVKQLELTEPRVFVAGFERPNLRLQIVQAGGDKQKLGLLMRILSTSPGSGIIYASTRKAVEMISAKLKMAGLSIEPYHAGMPENERTRAQERFMTGESKAIVATNAFGMGIDKSDIRFVAHYHLPGSVEAYYQEVGRAGRDGGPADCFLLFNYADTRTHNFFIEGNHPSPDVIASVYGAVARLAAGGKEVAVREIQNTLGIKNEMALQTSLALLEKAGHIERGRPNENVMKATLSVPLDAALRVTNATSIEGLLLRHLVYGAGISDRESIEFDLDPLSAELRLDRSQVRAALGTLSARGIIANRAIPAGRGVRLLDGVPAEHLSLDYQQLSARASAEQMKLRKMVDFCYAKRCLHGFILSYFGEKKNTSSCLACSACSPDLSPATIAPVKAAGAGTLSVPGGGSSSKAASSEPAVSVQPGAARPSKHAASSDPSRGLDATGPVHATVRPVHPESSDSQLRGQGPDPPVISIQSGNLQPNGAGVECEDDACPPRAIDEEETIVVRKVLSCVARLNGRFGKGTVGLVLKGAGSKEIAAHNLDKLPTYGLLGHMEVAQIAAFIKSLIKADCIVVSKSAYPSLSLTDAGREVMHGRVAIRLALPRAPYARESKE
jgi:ATP-dependent DNA helicase RecQ